MIFSLWTLWLCEKYKKPVQFQLRWFRFIKKAAHPSGFSYDHEAIRSLFFDFEFFPTDKSETQEADTQQRHGPRFRNGGSMRFRGKISSI